MAFKRLDLTGFRNLSSVKLKLLPHGINFFYGRNGSGKTSLIEAIHYCIYGRSFRSANANHLIQHHAEHLSVFGKIHPLDQSVIPIGLERSRNGHTKLRVAGEDRASFASLARLAPTLLIHSGSHQLLEAGPIFRRKYLDWGAFYLSAEYVQHWKQYARALRQRNLLLRKRIFSKELPSWTAELVKYGNQLHQTRQQFVEQLLPHLSFVANRLLHLPALEMSYFPGWQKDLSFAEAVEVSLANDMAAGSSQTGPHRADFNIKMNHIPVKDILSRGQQKLFVCAMLLAQGMLIKQCLEVNPVYLVDDLTAELDQVSQARLMALFLEQQSQFFLTAIDASAVAQFNQGGSLKMFHVEHGSIVEERPI
ncbi:MAG: DNA replication/repair protein RecF [Gammaproteobacteria bacterium]|nr:DNA replication/repair protein RecF [Gammaproteobacteria bacterium]